jgi:hypothetical protein
MAGAGGLYTKRVPAARQSEQEPATTENKPNFIFRLDRALVSFRKNTRFEQRPDVFGELGPKEIHRIFMDGSDEYPDPLDFSSLYEFLQFGDTTLHVASFLIPATAGCN